MQIQYGNTVLCSGQLSNPAELVFNGQAVDDPALLFRAIAASIYARGNKESDLEFTARWAFSTRAAAESFLLSHYASLPPSADLVVTTGDPGDPSAAIFTLASAILVSAQVTGRTGLSLPVRYRFRGGVFASQSVAPANEDAVIKRGTVALNSGDTAKAVTFAQAFGSSPIVLVRVNAPSSTSDSVGDWDADVADISSAGFTARGQPIPASGYWLHWEALSP